MKNCIQCIDYFHKNKILEIVVKKHFLRFRGEHSVINISFGLEVTNCQIAFQTLIEQIILKKL